MLFIKNEGPDWFADREFENGRHNICRVVRQSLGGPSPEIYDVAIERDLLVQIVVGVPRRSVVWFHWITHLK